MVSDDELLVEWRVRYIERHATKATHSSHSQETTVMFITTKHTCTSLLHALTQNCVLYLISLDTNLTQNCVLYLVSLCTHLTQNRVLYLISLDTHLTQKCVLYLISLDTYLTQNCVLYLISLDTYSRGISSCFVRSSCLYKE